VSNVPAFPDLQLVSVVALGGAVGSVARYLAGYYVGALLGPSFPYATLLVNVTGSALLGLVGTLSIDKPGTVDPVVRLLLTTGFAGGYTTFSALTFETLSLYQRGESGLAVGNIALNLIIGMISVWVGAVIARAL
jgi:fluoride exporter